MSSFLKQSAIVVASLLLGVLAAEVAVRAYFAMSVGPRIFFYGTPWHRKESDRKFAQDKKWEGRVQNHENHVGDYAMYTNERTRAYSKYFPGESKVTLSPEGDSTYDVRINQQGFRGVDFEIEKAPGTRRVLTLGASSTFGYHNRDDETYPFQLEQMLNEADGAGRWEVINFAIPHATTDNIVGMLFTEGFALAPDYITLYSGVNDSAVVDPGSDFASRLQYEVGRRLLLVKFLEHVIGLGRVQKDYVWSEEQAEERRDVYLDNVEEIRAEAEKRGVTLIVASQQAKSGVVPQAEMRGLDYATEQERLRAALMAGTHGPKAQAVALNDMQELARMLDPARVFLVHGYVMEGLREWASSHGVPYVDVIAALDDRRDLLLSWVHLHADANTVVAKAFAETILAEEARRSAR